MNEILNEFKGVSSDKINDRLFMKLAVVKNLCPNTKIGLGGTKFNPALEDESHILDRALAQPCSDLLFDCSLYELPMNCSRLFKSFTTGKVFT